MDRLANLARSVMKFLAIPVISCAVILGASNTVPLTGQIDSGSSQSEEQARQKKKESSPEELREIFQAIRASTAASRKADFAKAVKLIDPVIKKYPKASQLYLYRANARFSQGDIAGAIKDYDQIIALDKSSGPYLWQRGLALYYAGKYKEGREQFESHQKVNSQDVENAAWHFLCVARQKGLATARQKLIKIDGDSRIPMPEVFQLFAGKADDENVIAAFKKEDSRTGAYYGYLYLGLYHEAKGDKAKSLGYIRKAIDVNPYHPEILMGRIADIHLKLRKNKQTGK